MITGDHEELDNNQRTWSVSTTKTWGTMAFQVGLFVRFSVRLCAELIWIRENPCGLTVRNSGRMLRTNRHLLRWSMQHFIRRALHIKRKWSKGCVLAIKPAGSCMRTHSPMCISSLGALMNPTGKVRPWRTKNAQVFSSSLWTKPRSRLPEELDSWETLKRVTPRNLCLLSLDNSGTTMLDLRFPGEIDCQYKKVMEILSVYLSILYEG